MDENPTTEQRLHKELNRHLGGWKNYFDFGYPRVAFREINTYIRDRLTQHLRRRSQRPSVRRKGSAITNRSSVLDWCVYENWQPCNCLNMPATKVPGEPDAGKSACPVR